MKPSIRWLTRPRAAKYCGVQVSCFDSHIRPNVRFVAIGRRSLWDINDLDKFLESRKSEDAGEFLA